jgi:hypothetical protein
MSELVKCPVCLKRQLWPGLGEHGCNDCRSSYQVRYVDIDDRTRKTRNRVCSLLLAYSVFVVAEGVYRFPSGRQNSYQVGWVIGMISSVVLMCGCFKLFAADVQTATSSWIEADLKEWKSKLSGSQLVAIVVAITAAINVFLGIYWSSLMGLAINDGVRHVGKADLVIALAMTAVSVAITVLSMRYIIRP